MKIRYAPDPVRFRHMSTSEIRDEFLLDLKVKLRKKLETWAVRLVRIDGTLAVDHGAFQ